jgi:NADH-quinone oxidoreductase subunit J
VLDHIVFLVFSVFALIAAIRVVTAHRIFHAGLWLIVCFFGIAVLYMLLESPFMAGVQLMIYIGGVAVLTVIAIMVTKGAMREGQRTVSHSWSAAMIAVSLFLVLAWMTVQLPLPEAPLFPVPEGSLALLGAALVDPGGYLLPFQVVSLMLMIVLIGALYLGKER